MEITKEQLDRLRAASYAADATEAASWVARIASEAASYTASDAINVLNQIIKELEASK
jgi:isocitrate lyase